MRKSLMRGLPSKMPVPLKAHVATSDCEKPDSMAPPMTALTLATEPLEACAVTTSLPAWLTELAIMPPTG
jgi:hypothetical protein